jgi:UDP-N-acetylglucosamine:LPS N-acetylglucosamine transferase
MKICLACTPSGHLGDMLQLMEAFEGHEIFFLTWENSMSQHLKYRKYMLKNPINGPRFRLAWLSIWGLMAFPFFFHILLKEKPQIIVSTGAGEVVVPVFYMAKLLGIKTIFIESWSCVDTPSIGGKFVYPVSDVFLVQWEEMLKQYGKKAKYEGAII